MAAVGRDTRDRREYLRAWRQANPDYDKARQQIRKLQPEYTERERLRSIKRRAANSERLNEQARLRHAERMSMDPEYRLSKAKNALGWIKRNPVKALANSVIYTAKKLQAIPAWADREHIQTFYDIADAYWIAFGIEFEIDHIVPLRSSKVCGLHVSENLQLLPPLANRSKNNRHWPDMWHG